jgi:hypothetical protein
MEKTVKFYTEQELKEIKEIIKNPKSDIKKFSIVLGKKYDRNPAAVEVKMYQLRRKLHPEINANRKIPSSKPTNAPEQGSADIGVEVPNGMTFEGTPKKIMLHSDHFRIYF